MLFRKKPIIVNTAKEAKKAYSAEKVASKQRQEILTQWNTLFIEELKVFVEAEDLKGFISYLGERVFPPIFDHEPEEAFYYLLESLKNIFLAKPMCRDDYALLRGTILSLGYRFDFERPAYMVLVAWDNCCLEKITEDTKVEDMIRILLKDASEKGEVFEKIIPKAVKRASTAKEIYLIRDCIQRKKFRSKEVSDETRKEISEKWEIFLSREIEQVDNLKDARELFRLSKQAGESAWRLLAFEKWVQFASGNKKELNRAYEEAPEDHCRLIAYGVFRKATA